MDRVSEFILTACGVVVAVLVFVASVLYLLATFALPLALLVWLVVSIAEKLK